MARASTAQLEKQQNHYTLVVQLDAMEDRSYSMMVLAKIVHCIQDSDLIRTLVGQIYAETERQFRKTVLAKSVLVGQERKGEVLNVGRTCVRIGKYLIWMGRVNIVLCAPMYQMIRDHVNQASAATEDFKELMVLAALAHYIQDQKMRMDARYARVTCVDRDKS